MNLLSYRPAVVLSAAAFAISACGARSGFLDNGTDARDGGIGIATAHDSGVGPTGNPPLSRLCAFDASSDSAKAVLAVRVGHALIFVRSDGSQVSVHDLPSEGDVGWTSLQANADHVFVLVNFDQEGLFGAHQVLLDTTGNVSWMRDETVGTQIYPVAMNDLSIVAERAQTTDLTDHITADGLLVVNADGTARTAPGFSPIGAPGVDGAVPVQSIPPSDTSTIDKTIQLGWLRTDGTLHPASGAWTEDTHFAFNGTQLLHLDTAGAHLIVESLVETRAIYLPAPTSILQKISVSGRWALIGNDLRVDLDARTPDTQRAATIAGPSGGLRRFADAQRTIDEDGNVFDALRDDYLGRGYRSSDLGKTWLPIGGTVRRASELQVKSSSGTYLVTSASTFVGEMQWPDPPAGMVADVTGDEVQITRPSLNRTRILSDSSAIAVSGDGRCVAYVETDASAERRLRVWDLEADRTVDIVSSEGAIDVEWIEAKTSALSQP